VPRVCTSRSIKPDSPRQELQRRNIRFFSSISLRRGVLILGDWLSRLGECVSPKREPVCLSVLDAPPAQARFFVLGKNASRSRERCDSWAKCDLTQVSVTRLSECSKLGLCVELAQAR